MSAIVGANITSATVAMIHPAMIDQGWLTENRPSLANTLRPPDSSANVRLGVVELAYLPYGKLLSLLAVR
jgi:hypothetical protein